MQTSDGEVRRLKTAGLITLAGFSLSMLLTGMERAMAESTVTSRALQVEHITIKNDKKIRRGRGGAREEHSAAGPRYSGGAH
jgi:hypothetical protein